MKSAATPARGFRTDVQGLRAIAVGLVLLYHAGVPFLPGGYVGVDVFFVISGFLISSHLLEMMERDGRISFAQFYARRARRILPASFVVAFLTAIAVLVWYPPLGIEGALKDGLATVLYVPNIWFAIQNTDYLADHSPSPYQHYWSLGVEEQFYLLWPLILLVIFLLARRRRGIVVTGITILAVASLAGSVLLTPQSQPTAFFLLPTRAWELLAGALVGAFLLHRSPAIPGVLKAIGGWAGIAMIAASAALFDDATPFPGTAAILPVAGTALVILCGAGAHRGGPTAALSVRPMQFVGLISYSLYLVHWPLLVVPQAAIGYENPMPVWQKLLWGVALALPLAYLLYRFVESPLRAPASLVRRKPRVTLLATGAVTVVLALFVGGGAAWAGNRAFDGGEAVAAAPDFPVSPPNAIDFVPGNLRPSLDAVEADLPAVYADGCHHDVTTEDVQQCVYGPADASVRIAVFGDSHSAQWLPAVQDFAAGDPRIAVEAYTKSSCPAVSVTVLDKNVPYTSCDRWRAAVLDHLVADPPDIVVFSSYAWYPLEGVDGAGRTAAWADGVAETVSRLTEAGARTLVIADTPRFDAPPAVCVSANPQDVLSCAGDPAAVLDAPLAAAEADAVVGAGGRSADLTPYICGPAECPVIVDDLLVYRDVNHLTVAFVHYLAPALAEELAALTPAG